MKFAHLADLHIGKKLNGISLLEDQRYVLNQVVDIVKKEKVDGILLAGDIYQTSQPSSEALSLFDEFLGNLVKANIPCYMISGNHDSEQRIAYFSRLIRKANVFTNELFNGTIQTIKVEDEYGELHIHLLPFIKPIDLKKYYPDEKIDTYQKMMELVIATSNIDYSQRNILLCHQFITGAVTSDSEVFAIGTLDNINHQVFENFDYVALGHLHHPQHVGKDTIRYSGSLLKYSLSEINSNKSITIVDVKEKGNVGIDKIPLIPPHEMRELKGYYKDLMKEAYSEDYISVILEDDVVLPDAYLSLMTNFPNMISYRLNKNNEVYDHYELLDMDNKSVLDLFTDFYRGQNNDLMPSNEQLDLIKRIIDEIEEEKHETN